jgi:hypothetical protein
MTPLLVPYDYNQRSTVNHRLILPILSAFSVVFAFQSTAKRQSR